MGGKKELQRGIILTLLGGTLWGFCVSCGQFTSVVWLKVEFQAIGLSGFIFVLSTVFIISLNQMKEEREHELKRKAA